MKCLVDTDWIIDHLKGIEKVREKLKERRIKNFFNQRIMKKNATGYNYGECEICNATMQEKLIKQDFWIRDELIISEDIPAGVCPQCGEKVVKAEVGRWVTELIKNSERIAKAPRVSVPIIKFGNSLVI